MKPRRLGKGGDAGLCRNCVMRTDAKIKCCVRDCDRLELSMRGLIPRIRKDEHKFYKKDESYPGHWFSVK